MGARVRVFQKRAKGKSLLKDGVLLKASKGEFFKDDLPKVEAKKNKESNENGQKAKSPNQPKPRGRTLCMACPRPPFLMRKFPLVARPHDPDGAGAPPHFVTTKIATTVRPRGGGGASAL
ncbi:hypothetical protein PIB30_076646 [Stylosanthes scabra]|uniref:Uncharacterized protein n=1 Tax=Stylosanthes scabra TaxID=79078 RepID=A0ABU6VPV9_9FABA|nr:hypothetical protein [Stylosanthes scabra]